MVIQSATREKIISDRQAGKPIKDIISENKVSKATVHKILSSRHVELSLPSLSTTSPEPKGALAPPAHNDSDLEKVLETLSFTDESALTPSDANLDAVLSKLGPVTKSKKVKANKKISFANEIVHAPAAPVQESKTWSSLLSVEPSLEDDKAALIQKLNLNLKYYGDSVLKDIIPDVTSFKASLIKKSTSELKNLLALFESTRNLESTSMYIRNTYFMGTKLLEGASGYLKMNLSGLTDRLRAEQDLDMIFKEIAIQHASKFAKATSPEMRLLMVTLSTVVQIDMMNRVMSIHHQKKSDVTVIPSQNAPVAQRPQEPVITPVNTDQKDTEELLKKFSDL